MSQIEYTTQSTATVPTAQQYSLVVSVLALMVRFKILRAHRSMSGTPKQNYLSKLRNWACYIQRNVIYWRFASFVDVFRQISPLPVVFLSAMDPQLQLVIAS